MNADYAIVFAIFMYQRNSKIETNRSKRLLQLKSMSKNIAIVGAGILGLTLALRYSQQGHSVTIFESGSAIGGLAGTWQLGDYCWDKHYHVTLASDKFTRKLISEIGLSEQLQWKQTKTGFYYGDRIESLSDASEFLSFSPIGLMSKIRLALTILLTSRIQNWKKLEKISVEQWLNRISGREVFEKIWKPLLISKLGDSYRETSAAFIWATIKRMYAARSAGLKKEQFGYVEGGYSTVLQRLSELLADLGAEVRLDSQVSEVTRNRAAKVTVKYSSISKSAFHVFNASAANYGIGSTNRPLLYNSQNDFEESFDAVILTCPAPVAANLVPELTETERQKLLSVKYQGIVCASVLTRRPLSPFYVINLLEPMPFTGVIEMTALVDPKTFSGNGLIYLPKYAQWDDPIFRADDETLRIEFLAALERMFPAFDQNDVLAFKVSRVKYVFPLPTIGYSESVISPETTVKNVFLVNSSQIVNGTLNVNETIQLAESFFENYRI